MLQDACWTHVSKRLEQVQALIFTWGRCSIGGLGLHDPLPCCDSAVAITIRTGVKHVLIMTVNGGVTFSGAYFVNIDHVDCLSPSFIGWM